MHVNLCGTQPRSDEAFFEELALQHIKAYQDAVSSQTSHFLKITINKITTSECCLLSSAQHSIDSPHETGKFSNVGLSTILQLDVGLPHKQTPDCLDWQ